MGFLAPLSQRLDSALHYRAWWRITTLALQCKRELPTNRKGFESIRARSIHQSR